MRKLGDCGVLAEGGLGPKSVPPPGVLDVVPAFGSVAVHFDPAQTSLEAVADWARRQEASHRDAAARTVEIPVAYGGEHGPDLDTIARRSGLSADEVARRHAAAEYTVGAVGFQPGFGYLTGLPAELHTSRRETPRTRVPAGAVGVGGPYTGVYPSDSPGGWNLLGRTPLVMFDEARDEPSLLRHGDRVRFRAIDAAEYERLAAKNRPSPPPESPPPERPLLRVVSPGVQTTVQGLGVFGRQHLGVSPGGAMDTSSLRLANLLVGNHQGAPALEATLVGPVLEALEPVTLGVAGAVTTARQIQLKQGQRLDLRQLVRGVRLYVSAPGGIAGRTGRAVVADDPLGAAGVATAPAFDGALAGVGWRRAAGGGAITLRALRGPQADAFGAEAWRAITEETYRVSPRSSRMGVRLEGSSLRHAADDGMPSQPVCHGVVQVPPDGQPIVLGADRQTLGGYPVIAVVVSADWPALGQLTPGDTVRFSEVTFDEAVRLRKKLERELATAAVGIRFRCR